MFPYLAANAATPLAAVILGKIPVSTEIWTTLHLFGREYVLTHATLIQGLAYGVFLGSLLPLIFGGKIYNSLKGGDDLQDRHRLRLPDLSGHFLFDLVDLCEIGVGFFRFGTVPVQEPGTTRSIISFSRCLRGDGFPADRPGDDRSSGRLRRHRRTGRADELGLEQLHARSGMGHGLSRRRHSQRHRRTQYFAVARRHGVRRHARIDACAGSAGTGI